ncbi:hypothetical protein O0L34_g12241 [Tuta absoluta]|nr:hypothetical protein O0L34_g12241 [Tuta absoluta]
MKPIIKRVAGEIENLNEKVVVNDKEVPKVDNGKNYTNNQEFQGSESDTVETQNQESFKVAEPLKPGNNQNEENFGTTRQPQNYKQKNHVVKRQKRFINPFQKSPAEQQQNFFFKLIEFIFKQGRNIPVYSVMREINTLVKSSQGELNHALKEANNYIGAAPPVIPVTYSLELGNENKAVAFMKKLLGLTPKGDRLTISGTGK